MEKLFEKALDTGCPVVIMYCSKKGIITKQLVSIESVKENWVGGFCHLRQSFRRFQKENILACFPAEKNDLFMIKTYTTAN